MRSGDAIFNHKDFTTPSNIPLSTSDSRADRDGGRDSPSIFLSIPSGRTIMIPGASFSHYSNSPPGPSHYRSRRILK